MQNLRVLFVLILCGPFGFAQKPTVLPLDQQIAAAVLPLPPPMRGHATVIGYAPDFSLVTAARIKRNGLHCDSSRQR